MPQRPAYAYPDIILIDPNDVICDQTDNENNIMCDASIDGKILFRTDGAHLNHTGSTLLGKKYLRMKGNPLKGLDNTVSDWKKKLGQIVKGVYGHLQKYHIGKVFMLFNFLKKKCLGIDKRQEIIICHKILENQGNNNCLNLDTSDYTSSKIGIIGNNNNISIEYSRLANVDMRIGSGNSNTIKFNGTRINNSKIEIYGDNNAIIFDENVSISSMEIFMRGNNHRLLLGNGVYVYGKVAFWFEDSDNNVIIGQHTTIGSANIAIAEPDTEIVIGDDCMFGNNVTLKNSDFHSIIDQSCNRRINYAKSIVLKNHVWLGESSHVLKNVTINDNSIVALGAVVTKDVPSCCVVAGNPAKVIKENVTWSRERLHA